MKKISNPHDKLFRETWSDIDNAREYLRDRLPKDVLDAADLDTIEICKDSFIEGELKDSFSDLLYKMNFNGKPGYIHLLFEHKSWEDKHIHLQLLEYKLKIWRLHFKQMDDAHLPVIITMVLYHGKKQWEVKLRLSEQLFDAQHELKDYIPDFKYILHDLTQYPDEEIKGTIISKVVQLLFKHVFDPDFEAHLPKILSLLRDLMEQETGLKYLETLLRYLFSTIDIEMDKLKYIVEQSLDKNKEGLIMATLAERLINQGIRQEAFDSIYEITEAKFEKLPDDFHDKIAEIQDIQKLKEIRKKLIRCGSMKEAMMIFD